MFIKAIIRSPGQIELGALKLGTLKLGALKSERNTQELMDSLKSVTIKQTDEWTNVRRNRTTNGDMIYL